MAELVKDVMRKTGIRNPVTCVKEFHKKHKDICICHQGCTHFKPELPEEHCGAAQASFGLSKMVGIVLVHSCQAFDKGK